MKQNLFTTTLVRKQYAVSCKGWVTYILTLGDIRINTYS